MERTRAVAYLRVSTDQQAERERGVSLDAQRAKTAAYAALYDIDLVATVVDAGIGAKSLDRPGLSEALGMLEAVDRIPNERRLWSGRPWCGTSSAVWRAR